jgi:hypothetical protein
MSLDVDRLAEAMLAGTQALIAKAVAPLIAANETLAERNASLEARLVAVEAREVPPSIDPDAILGLQAGLASAVAAIEAREEPDIAAAVQEAVAAAVAGLEPPEAPDVASMIAEAVRAAVEALPAAPDLSGFATKEEVAEARASFPDLLEAVDLSGFATKADLCGLVSIDEVRAAIPDDPDLSGFATKDHVAEAVAAIRLPEPIPGKPGVGIASAKMNADGELILKRDDGETFNVGKVRGADGLGFEDMSTDWDGERMLTLSFTRDGRTEVTSMTIPAMIDRGVWRERSYDRGDVVSWGGSMWVAQRDTSDKPETSDAWRLSVKRGRDGNDYRDRGGDTGPVKVGVPRK